MPLAAASGLGIHALSLQFEVTSASGGRLSLITSLDLRRHHHERLLYISGIFGRCLNEANAQALRMLDCKGVFNGALARQVTLVTHEQLVHIVIGVPVDFVEPLLDIVVRFEVRCIIYHDDTVCTAVVR